MGILRPHTGNEFIFESNLEQFAIVANGADGSLGFEYEGQGIPFIHTDTSFLGSFHEVELSAGKVQLLQYQGWSDAILKDETYEVDELEEWDESTGAEALINYLFDETSDSMYFEGTGIFESLTFPLGACRRLHSNLIDYVSTVPSGASVQIQVAVSSDNGTTYEAWQNITDNASFERLASGMVLENYRMKYRAILYPTADLSQSPILEEFKVSLYSRTILKLTDSGDMKLKGTQEESYSENF